MIEVATKSWIEKDFGAIDFNDQRLTKRFKEILHEFTKKAQSNISSAFNNWASIKACYRFFDNEKVNHETILAEHIKSSISRIHEANEPIIIIHDMN